MSNFWQSLLQLLPPYRKLLAEIALARQETANLQATLQIVSEQANLCKLQRDVLQEEAKRLLQEKEDSQISLETVSEHADMMEEQLLETRNLLEQKVIERTRELAEKNIELQQEIRQRRRIEKAQRNNLVFLKTLLNSLPNPIFYKNLQGQFLGCNSAFERCIGLTEVQLEGLTVHELYPPIMAKEYHQRDLTLFRNQQDQIYESFVRYADGTDHYVIYHQTPFNSAEGKLAGLVGVMVDISEHRRAAEALRVSEQYSSTLIRESLIGLVLTRLEGTFVEVNPAYADILGYSVTEMLKLNYWQLSPDKYAQLEQEQRLTLETTGRYGPYEKEYIHKKGYLVPVRLSGLIIEKGGERFIWSSVEDITEQKRAEAALLQAKESAEQAKLVAEMASRAKSTFLANMSHELRTPLNAIIGYSEILQEDLAEAEQLEFIPDLQKIRSAGEHLLRLISDVLDISRIEAGKVVLNLETFDIKQMVQETVETITPLLKENNNTLHLYYGDDLGLLHTDLTKIRQSLLNLLNNANKFTENGNIYLSITQENYNDVTWINFSVKDTGIGMTAEQSSKLFQAFVQIDDAPTRKYGGTGLGLAITKHFIQKMGGTIEVESHYGEGSVFTIRLPISQ